MYSEYRCVPVDSCLVMNDGTTPKELLFICKPLTALGFTETMKMENHTAIIHTAAASNLGQMLVKICKADDIPLVNIVRKEEHVNLLKDLGAEYVCNMSEDSFMADLIAAIDATGATLGFDATGGGNEGKLAGQILSAMEISANKKASEYSRYGSDTYKQVYIYGGLDPTPTVLNRSYGLQGFRRMAFNTIHWKSRTRNFLKMRERVANEITTTFSSSYTAEISLEEMLIQKF